MKTKTSRFPALGLAVVAMVLSTLHVPAQPNLGITRSGNGPVLSWSTTVSNCVLQSATNLAAPQWLAVTNPGCVFVGSNCTVTITDTARTMYFRLYGTNTTFVPAGMVLIPAGSFTIGDTLDDDTDFSGFGSTNAIPTNVCVSAFYMDKNLVSYSQWQAICDWAITNGYSFDTGTGKGPSYPADNLNWYDCVKWCNARSEKEGRTPAYYTNAAQQAVYRSGSAIGDNFCVKRTAGYRLPTEAEWEKAARGGMTGLRFPWGNTISETQANYYGWPYSAENGGYTYDYGPGGYNAIGMIGANDDIGPFESPVGSFPPNGYGLYDLAGNVEEWCWDYYVPSREAPIGSPYLGGSNPCGPNWDGGLGRVLRGGDCWSDAPAARCAERSGRGAASSGDEVGFGFRCVVGASGFGDAFFDGFSNALNSADWSVSQTTANLYSVNATQGTVQLAKATHNPGGTQNVAVNLNLAPFGGPITNDFSIQIDFTNAVVPGPGVDQVELRTYYQDGSVFIAGYEYNGGLQTYTSWDGIVLFPVPATGNSGTLRICRTASEIDAFFNGTAFWGQGNTASSLTNVTFVLQNSSGSDDATSVSFDNFSLTSPSLPAR